MGGILLFVLAWIWEIHPSRLGSSLFSPLLKGISVAGGGLRKEFERYIWLTRVRQENERLLRENEALKSRLVELQDQLDLCKALKEEEKEALFRRYPRVLARVIYHPLSPFEGLLIIDKGGKDGLRPEMPVVSVAEGEPGVLVGQVVETTRHYARVLPLTHPQSAVDVYSLRSKERGLLKGRGMDQPLLLDYVPYGTDFRVGDLLVTSGLDALFPRNIRVGRIVRILPQRRQGFFQTIEVEPLVDLRRLSWVAVLIKPLRKKELSP
ncbi:rod shape-determining protein MreC [Thermosulfurimonas marina]|uniref:rod shape-determining protein MreC n=1 Tax=Thermosulfurimonas marina TaxID=2047767 RepID=UPI001B317451|nr:rod shape-determining protein MreC [Thermosulfurimonas marina]